MSRGQALVPDVAHFRRRFILDALAEASRAYWLHRAADFAAVGASTCDEIARACRSRAALAVLDDWPEVDEVLAEMGGAA